MGLVVGAVRAVPRALGRRVLRGRALEDGADRVEQRRGRADGRVEVLEGRERQKRRGGHVRAPRVARRRRARNEVLEQVEEGPDLVPSCVPRQFGRRRQRALRAFDASRSRSHRLRNGRQDPSCQRTRWASAQGWTTLCVRSR